MLMQTKFLGTCKIWYGMMMTKLLCYYFKSRGKWYEKCQAQLIMNSTEVQNPRRKCLCLSCNWFCPCLCKVCSRVSEALLLTLRTLSLIANSSSDRLFYVSLCSQAHQQQYIVYYIHYGIALWTYIFEPLVKDSHKSLSSTEKPQILHAQLT